MSVQETAVDLRERNRRTVWILLTVMGTLIAACLMVGIRW